jgi:hypothetical protein
VDEEDSHLLEIEEEVHCISKKLMQVVDFAVDEEEAQQGTFQQDPLIKSSKWGHSCIPVKAIWSMNQPIPKSHTLMLQYISRIRFQYLVSR